MWWSEQGMEWMKQGSKQASIYIVEHYICSDLELLHLYV